MIHFEAQDGGRYVYSEDVKNLQDLALSFRAMFAGCGNFVISGCAISNGKMSEGYVFINNEIRHFAETSFTGGYPKYLCEDNRKIDISYYDSANKLGRIEYGVVLQDELPTGPDPVTGETPQTIRIDSATFYPSLKNALFGKYAVILSPGKEQAIAGALTAVGLKSTNSLDVIGAIVQGSGNSHATSAFDSDGVFTTSITSGDKTVAIKYNPADGSLDVSELKEDGTSLSGKYAKIGDAYTKTEADNKFVVPANVYSKVEAETKFATLEYVGKTFATPDYSYSKAEANAKFITLTLANETFAKKGDAYTKDETYSATEMDRAFAKSTEVDVTNYTIPGQSSLLLNCRQFGKVVVISGIINITDPTNKRVGDVLFTLPNNAPKPSVPIYSWGKSWVFGLNTRGQCALSTGALDVSGMFTVSFTYIVE